MDPITIEILTTTLLVLVLVTTLAATALVLPWSEDDLDNVCEELEELRNTFRRWITNSR